MTTRTDQRADIAMAVHGGAFLIPTTAREGHREGCRRALEIGLEVLEEGGTAVEAVQAAVVCLEDDESFDAGFGSFLNAAGAVETDAAIMDGASGRIGAVACLTCVRNPIQVASLVMDSDQSMVVGEGARLFAATQGTPLCRPDEMVSPRERLRWATHPVTGSQDGWEQEYFGDTVGAVALDSSGNLAAATSTGGTPGKIPGRVGDSPLIGAGLYADRRAAVSVSGHGERITQVVWAKHAVDLVGAGRTPDAAAEAAVDRLAEVEGRGGLIVVDADGRVGVHWNAGAMAYAFKERDSVTIVDGPLEESKTASVAPTNR